MGLTEDQQKRVDYIVHKGKSLETQVKKLEKTLKGSDSSDPDPVKVKLRLDNHLNRPRLPEIKIPTFDGNSKNWASFKHKFKSLIHNREDLSDAIKASQFFSCLSEKTLDKVNELNPSARDYKRAWQSLLGFYDQKRVIAVQRLNAILNLSKLTSATADGLSSLVGKACEHLHILNQLESRNKRQENYIVARALLDSCFTVNLITEKFAKLLNLPTQKCSVNIGAVDSFCTVSKQQLKAIFQSSYNNSKHQLNFLIVPNIADYVPNEPFSCNQFDIPKNIKLADPQFHLPKAIDILLASNTTLSVLTIVAGGAENPLSSTQKSCNIVKLDKLVERFWFIEDFDHEPVKSCDEVASEQHDVTHTKRDSTGRYIIRLPFRDSKFNLRDLRQQALKRYYSLERKFESDLSLKTEYTKVMDEYISLSHMTLCDETEDGHYLPHHAVIKESSKTTKLQVVFDALTKASTGIFLNDTLMIGPTI
ncbi:uncharacterized protein LOC106643850 [Copidosoma floridanum]|uniref:uncharacterized protein LOC106643850 n=1 Tax=Copidosoma floridanum TaxID=29053 RepID=UPI0006C9AB43|nr:uncharacterized protein LOC106643850 [Copidosoma floridanum]